MDILYDHYKETFALCKEAQVRRNKNFILLCILEALSFLMLIRPEKALTLLLDGIKAEWNLSFALGNTILQTLLWLLIIYTMIRYIQDMLYIERQYSYINKLEREIARSMSVDIFSRESGSYLKDYPMVLNFIDLFYKMFMPVFFMIINAVRIYKEWIAVEYKLTLPFLCDSVLHAALFLIVWFYFFEIHPKITVFLKRHVPFVDKIARVLRRWLKEV